MDISKFQGINAYHDGMAVSDYCNMIPLGTSIIDREGEILEEHSDYTDTRSKRETISVIETFIDSLGNIYVACTDGLKRYKIDGEYECQEMDIGAIGQQITFCESATKPSQVFCCTSGKVWFWNTEDIPTDRRDDDDFINFFKAFKPIQLPICDIDAVRNKATIAGAIEGPGLFFPPINSDNYDLSKFHSISRVTWFDNKLVLVEVDKNTVWLSQVDPARYLHGDTPLFTENEAWTGDEQSDTRYLNAWLPHYYASTASSARLQDAIAFAGQLFFLNESSIELWSATGNVDNPIQHNSQNTLYYGGREPVIISDTLYLICRDKIHNDFIAAISQSGQIQKISNNEIERQLQPGAKIMRPLSVRDQSMVVVYKDNTYATGYTVTKDGFWWRYYNGTWRNDFIAWTIANINGKILNVSNRGYLVWNDSQGRKWLDGREIPRHVRGAFNTFVGRKILRDVEVVCDTGIYYDLTSHRAGLYLRVSFDRGMSFGPFLYRKLGNAGTNDRQVIWRNCGSGNSILLEFGTSDNVRFQIYSIQFNLA